MAKPTRLSTISPEVILEACNNDLDLVDFYNEWLNNGRNATAAYLKLYPDVSYATAATLASRLFKKVDKNLIMQAFGLSQDLYFDQLYQGVTAQKWTPVVGLEADHTTRKPYHDKLGRLLGLEEKNQEVSNNFNFVVVRKEVVSDKVEG